jgi:hypothetical protein
MSIFLTRIARIGTEPGELDAVRPYFRGAELAGKLF